MTQMEFDLGYEVTVLMPLTEVDAPAWAIPPYSGGEAHCRKCGNDTLVTVFHASVQVHAPCYAMFMAGGTKMRETVPFPEHLDRRCANCSFTWVERTTDWRGD